MTHESRSKPTIHGGTAAALLVLLPIAVVMMYQLITAIPYFAYAEWGIQFVEHLVEGKWSSHVQQSLIILTILSAINYAVVRTLFVIAFEKDALRWRPRLQLILIALGGVALLLHLFIVAGGYFWAGPWEMDFG